jgi:enoyl-CoA hydratase
MAADIRIARKDAGKVGLPEINLGVLAGTGGTQRLARIVGKGKAIEMMVTGNNLSFEDAQQLGIVQQVMEGNAENFRRDVLDWASQFTIPNKAAMAAGHIKRAVQSGAELPLEYGLALERELQAKLFASKDAKEGIAAYVEKRVANFKGN